MNNELIISCLRIRSPSLARSVTLVGDNPHQNNKNGCVNQ